MNKRKEQINVSEIFHSLQGEGSTTGMPSVFLRLQACNLMCGGIGTQRDKKLHNGATWRCDTIEVWQQGNRWVTEELAKHLHRLYAGNFLNGSQLVITGGEPLLQQDQFRLLKVTLGNLLKAEFRIEIETNGTILPTDETVTITDQFNVSPKLSNSGMEAEKRIKTASMECLSRLARRNKAIFKFVITRPEDIKEVFEDYIKPFDIPKSKVWLMPGCSTQDQYNKVAPLVADIAKDRGLHFSTRLQINLWNETTGV